MISLLPIFIALIVSGLESVSYLGFIRNNFFIPSWLVYLLTLGALLYLPRPTKKSSLFISSFLVITAIFVSLIFFILSLVESMQYENYIYSVLHLNLKGLEILLAVAILSYYLFSARERDQLRIAQAGLRGTLIIILVLNITKLTPIMISSLTPIISEPFASYDDKMTRAYPGFYPFMLLVKSHTPENSTIIIPPQSAPWVTEGNSNMVTRFLYPRRILQLEDLPVDEQRELYYLIAKGFWPSDGTYEPGWPKTIIPAQAIWQFDINTMTSVSYARDYDPSSDNWELGLIKASHE